MSVAAEWGSRRGWHCRTPQQLSVSQASAAPLAPGGDVLRPAGTVVPAGRVFLFFWQRGHETCVAAACHSHGSRQWGGSPLTLTLSDPLRQPAPRQGQACCRFCSCYCLLLPRSLMPLPVWCRPPGLPLETFTLPRAKRGPDTLSGAWGREVSTWSLAAACHGLEPHPTS